MTFGKDSIKPELKTTVAINRLSDASTADHSPNFSCFVDDLQREDRKSFASNTGPFEYEPQITDIKDKEMESSDSEDEWEYEEDNYFDPADSIFGSEAI